MIRFLSLGATDVPEFPPIVEFVFFAKLKLEFSVFHLRQSDYLFNGEVRWANPQNP